MYLTYIRPRGEAVATNSAIASPSFTASRLLACLLRLSADRRRGRERRGAAQQAPLGTSGEGDVGGTYYMYMQLGLHCK